MPSTSSFYNIINNVWDSSNHALRMSLSYSHDHSTGSQGGQLDWDTIWSDAVHSHGTDTEGGQLDWDVVWSDAVHTHGTDTEGGTIDAATAVPNAVTKNTLTTLGDIPYASGSATWTRNAIGSANSIFTVNSGGTGYSWINAGSANYVLTSGGLGSTSTWQPAPFSIVSGQYSGDSTVDRSITHNIGRIPKSVYISATDHYHGDILNGGSILQSYITSGEGSVIVNAPDGTSFYVGDAVSFISSMNQVGVTYRWVAEG